MTPCYIRVLIDYNYWSRDRTLLSAESLSAEQLSRNLGSSFGSVLDTLVHMYSAEWVWYSRWQGESPTAFPDKDRFGTLADLREAWLGLEHQIRSFVGGLDAERLGRPLDYRLMSGQTSTSVHWQMIVHVINHGSYHRGQIATMLRQLGAKPAASTDMIAFFREQSAHAR